MTARSLRSAVLVAAVGAAVLAAPAPAAPFTYPGTPATPLTVSSTSRIVVMEYEASYGPAAFHVDDAVVRPSLTSTSMSRLGLAGYDSADPGVLEQHIAWLEQLGVDAVTVDVSNDAPCAFDGPEISSVEPTCTSDERTLVQAILANENNLYAAFTPPTPPNVATRLKLIPVLDAQSAQLLWKDLSGRSALEHEVDNFDALMTGHKNLSVLYKGHPLMILFTGPTPCYPALSAGCSPTVADTMAALDAMTIHGMSVTSQYTFVIMGGYFDAQWQFWANQTPGFVPTSPNPLAAAYPFWTWVDRRQAAFGYQPTYATAGTRVEAFTASVAVAGANGWAAPHVTPLQHATDDALRGSGTLAAFLGDAQALDPIFTVIHQFNEYGAPNTSDEGWDGDTTDGIEPNTAVGSAYLTSAAASILAYRANPKIFTATGANQAFVVPHGVTSLSLEIWGGGGGGGRGGAAGGCNVTGGSGGAGGYARATLAVTAGQTLTLVVGGGGAAGIASCAAGATAAGGFGGGGAGQGGDGAGGGRSAILVHGVELLVAGGGGGGGGGASTGARPGGGGGGSNGVGEGAPGGAGGTQSAAGGGGIGAVCTGGAGGTDSGGKGGGASACWGAGGGGGYRGGGGGGANGEDDGGGGGGASYVGSVTGAITTAGSGAAPAGTTSTSYVPGTAIGGGAATAGGAGEIAIGY
ncbi:MAG TPA: hypothetical protein VH165_19195 [Kofleriaceae bacterium]|jgi:hypothetical protein|nr:hypothetical protein [Kofleriaceae bacterium]